MFCHRLPPKGEYQSGTWCPIVALRVHQRLIVRRRLVQLVENKSEQLAIIWGIVDKLRVSVEKDRNGEPWLQQVYTPIMIQTVRRGTLRLLQANNPEYRDVHLYHASCGAARVVDVHTLWIWDPNRASVRAALVLIAPRFVETLH
jgi:hypothetical protein